MCTHFRFPNCCQLFIFLIYAVRCIAHRMIMMNIAVKYNVLIRIPRVHIDAVTGSIIMSPWDASHRILIFRMPAIRCVRYRIHIHPRTTIEFLKISIDNNLRRQTLITCNITISSSISIGIQCQCSTYIACITPSCSFFISRHYFIRIIVIGYRLLSMNIY